jgi:hypothetical protein
MSIEVELPDGTIVEFPDGASSGFISTILKRNSVEGKPLFRSIGGVQARQQEIRAVDSNKPSMDSFLNFMSGGFKPDIQGGDRLSNIGQYAAEDLSQLAEFGLGGVANFANNANQNQDNSVMDTVLAGAELIPSGALAGQATRLAGKGASRLFSEALDQSLRSPMTNQAGTIGVKASKSLPKDDLVVAIRYEDETVTGKRGDLHFSIIDDNKGKALELGFADSKGKFYSRDDALTYIKQSVPTAKGMQLKYPTREGGLDSKDLNLARGGDELLPMDEASKAQRTQNDIDQDKTDLALLEELGLSRNGESLGNKGLLGDNAGMKLSQTEKQDWLDQVQAQHPTQYDSGVKKARRKGKHKTVDGLYQYVKNNMLGMQKANTPIKKTKVWAPMESDFDLDEMGFKQTYSSNSRNDNGFDSGATSSFSNYWTHPSGATVRYSDHAPVNARAAGHDVLIHPNSHASNEEALKSIEDAISKRMNK